MTVGRWVRLFAGSFILLSLALSHVQEGKLKIGIIAPTAILSFFPHAAELKAVAGEVDAETRRMIDEAR